MRGSLAVWCDTSTPDIEGHPPRIDLHFNIWCDLPDGIPNVLDVGLLFKEYRTIESVYFYIPGRIVENDIIDLSPILSDSTTLSAVFNDTFEVGDPNNAHFDVRKGNVVFMYVMKLDVTRHLSIEHIKDDGNIGTILKFTKSILMEGDAIGDRYVRFRIKLCGTLSKMFVNEVVPIDKIFSSTFYRTEIIEFRINERRNFGASLRKRFLNARSPVIGAVQYFLIRKVGVDLIRSHADFRKMRRLEPKLWDNYLGQLGRISAENMLIYHWRSAGDGRSGVEDFIALAIFRTSRNLLLLFLAAIVLLGAIGSAVQASLICLMHAACLVDEMWWQFGVLGSLLCCLALLYMVSKMLK